MADFVWQIFLPFRQGVLSGPLFYSRVPNCPSLSYLLLVVILGKRCALLLAKAVHVLFQASLVFFQDLSFYQPRYFLCVELAVTIFLPD